MLNVQAKPASDERTTPSGLYHYAMSYESAARLLHGALDREAASHASAPANHLLTHAIELYLKAFLRLSGATLDELRLEFGHDIPKLAKEFAKKGGTVTKGDLAVFAYLTPANTFAARHILVGAYVDVGANNLAKTAANLHGIVRDAIRASGTHCMD